VRVVSVPKFLTPYGVIEFVPVSDMPGFTHQIAVNGRAQPLWCPQGKHPGKSLAQFFTRVYCALQEGRPKYHYTDRNEDPPLPANSTQQVPVDEPALGGGPNR
jgi:hypothetical protein